MKIYKPFSIVVVPFPFSDIDEVKRRPALVLSQESFQKNTEHVTLMMITSAQHSKWHDDYEIKDLHSTGLRAASIIRQKIFTLDMRVILSKTGMLGAKDKEALIKITQKHLALA